MIADDKKLFNTPGGISAVVSFFACLQENWDELKDGVLFEEEIKLELAKYRAQSLFLHRLICWGGISHALIIRDPWIGLVLPSMALQVYLEQIRINPNAYGHAKERGSYIANLRNTISKCIQIKLAH
ncbi:MAG: hypothetical protein ACXV8Q_02230 [Methylobacter sp.]